MDRFVQLHLHSMYSTLDGIATPKEIAQRAKELNQPAVALTDHGNMVGWYEFVQECREAGIKPIVGNEMYITDDRHKKEKGTKHYHLVLLAMNDVGLKNLFKLTAISYLEGFYSRPRIDWEVLREYNEGLICLSACLASYPARLISEDNPVKAKKVVMKFKKIFGDRFFLEIQPNEHTLQRIVNKHYVEWSRELEIPLVATTDAHYLDPEKYESHRIFTKIGGFDSDVYKHNYWTTSEEVVRKLVEYTEVPEEEARKAVENTVKIAEMVEEYHIDTSTKLPHFPIPPEFPNEDEYLKQLCREGWIRRGINKLPKDEQKVYLDRLLTEFDVIFGKGFSGYFLIVQDFVNWARKNGIVVGYGRGSAGGSLVSWLLGIVELDPIKHGLLFERFLNPERNELPDIDIDFADREQVYQYLIEKYGADRVASVLTFGTMGAKGCIRDVGRALGIPLKEVDRIAKMIPERQGIKLEEAIEEVPELKEEMEKYPDLFKYAFEYEGRVRHYSTHASALIIADRPIVEVAPLMLDSSGKPQVMVEMNTCAQLGLVKFDLLGLKTLAIIQKTVDLINEEMLADELASILN